MAKSKKERASSSGVLLFAAAFLGVLVLCAVGVFLWWTLAKPTVPWWPFGEKAPAETVTPTEPASLYDATDRLSVAVYITDEHHVVQTVSLVMICPDTTQIAVSGLPAELSMSADETDTLTRRFRFSSVTDAQNGISRCFDTTVSQYIALSYAQIESYLTALDQPLIVNLPVDIHEQNEDGSFAVHLTAGENALSPAQVSNLLKCTDYQDGRRERATMHARVIAAYLAQFVTRERSLSADYSQLYENADTAWSASQFSAAVPHFEYILAENADPITLIPTSGDFSGAGATLRFAPDAAMREAIVACVPDDRIQREEN